MKMLPQRGPEMFPGPFEDIFGCPRIRGKTGRKFEGHNCNIQFEKLKLVCPNLFFGYGVPF